MKSLNPVCRFDIHVAALDRAKEFYETVFNIQLTDLPIEWERQSTFPFKNKGVNVAGALIEKENYTPNINNIVIYFSSENCLTGENKVIKAGGKILKSKIPFGEFDFVSLLTDTEGNTILDYIL